MDLSRFDTREAAEAGVDVPLVIDGETILGDDGEPITFRLKGAADTQVHAVILKTKPGKTPEEVIENDMRLARVAIIGWSANFTVGGEKLAYSRDNLDKVMGNPKVRRAVLSEVWNEANFTPRL